MIFDQVRGEPVIKTPEEVVRQRFISYLIEEVGVPLGLIGVEVGLDRLPHIKMEKGKIPRRRIDLIVYSPSGKPLLLAECKATSLGAEAERQLIGYNHYVQAPFICLINHEGLRFGYFEGPSWLFIDHIPRFEEMVESLIAIDVESSSKNKS